MHVLDSRRLTGPGLLLDTSGAVIELAVQNEQSATAIEAWMKAARTLLNEVGWTAERLASRPFHGGVSLALSAPVDGLYSATEIAEEAWDAAAAELDGLPLPDLSAVALRLRKVIEAERNPELAALKREAESRGLTFLSDEDQASVGTTVDEGDYSGPGGARLVLRQPAVEAAVLETARGGILRRGLATSRANVAVVTNIAEDHLGEFGVGSLEELAETKLLVGRSLVGGGSLVLNADDAVLVRASSTRRLPIIWFSLDGASEVVARHAAAGGTAVVVEGEDIVLIREGARTAIVRTRDAPFTFGGTARHNVANALAAVAAATKLEIPLSAIANALRSFGKKPGDNPGRANLYEVGGARILVDYAHNAHGMSALVGLAQGIPADRRLVMLGQAGDRQDEAIRETARAASSLRPDRVIVKDAEQYLRGRALGEVPAILA